MSKTLNKKLIYEKIKEIIEKREENWKQLKNKDYKYNKKLRSKGKNNSKSRSRKVNNSMDNIVINKQKKRKRKKYIINDKIKKKK